MNGPAPFGVSLGFSEIRKNQVISIVDKAAQCNTVARAICPLQSESVFQNCYFPYSGHDLTLSLIILDKCAVLYFGEKTF